MLEWAYMKFRNYKQVFSYFESFTNLEKGSTTYTERNYRIDKMSIILELFDNPHKSFKSIHIAGTKGKGSTAVFIASILNSVGYTSGLFTSPHVSSYRERITVSLKSPKESILIKLGNEIKDKIDNLGKHQLPDNTAPTTFELLTVFSFLIFRELKCDYAVIETGIGGRLDSTNVITPIASVITPIDLEHQDILGNSIEEIAAEKAGIIKPGKPVFSGFQNIQVKKVLEKYAALNKSDIFFLDEKIEQIDSKLSTEGTKFSLKLKNEGNLDFYCKLIGEFQAENASLAYIVIKKLFPQIDLRTINSGLFNAYLPGRMEIVKQNPVIIFDAAHTPLAIKRMLESYKKLFPEKGILIFGSVIDKSPEKMAPLLGSHFTDIIISTPGNFKKSNLEKVSKIFKLINKNTILIKKPFEALKKAVELSGKKGNADKSILVTGSFYMVSEIRKLIIEEKFRSQDYE